MTRYIAFIMVGLFMSACYDFSLEDPKETSGTDGSGETGGAEDSTDGCAFDIDCEGDRICVKGSCVEPNASGGIDSGAVGIGGSGGTRGVSGSGGSSSSDGGAGKTVGSIETGGAGGGDAVFDAAVDGNVGGTAPSCPVDRPVDGDACNEEILCGYDGSICTCEASMWRCTIECPQTPPNTLDPCLPTWPITCNYADRSCGCLVFIWSCKDNDGGVI